MSLTVDTDTYISLDDADTYVEENYASTEAKRTDWEALTDADKEVYLRKAAKIIDRQPLIGIKAVIGQDMEFPRAIKTEYSRNELPVLHTYFDADWYVQDEVPDEVKYAQVEIALELAQGIPKRVEMQRQGVKSFSLSKLSESYGAGSDVRIISHEAKELLAPYLAGSVPIQ